MLCNQFKHYEEMLARVPEAAKIGAGASGTVRIAWLQERRLQHRDGPPSAGGADRPAMLLGSCAAVAVKRVALPCAMTGGQRAALRRQMLLRELQLLERMRCHPHPNVVQCWGFHFAHPDHCAARGAGLALTALEREQRRAGTADDDPRVFGVAPYVDMCLSLCTGGALDAYVRRRVADAIRARAKAQCAAGLATPTKCSEALSLSALGITDTPPAPGRAGGVREGDEDTAQRTPLRGEAGGEEETIEMALQEREMVAILYALVNGLRHTHEVLQTLHRDVKPANVLLCDGAGNTPSFVKPATCDALTSLLGLTTDTDVPQRNPLYKTFNGNDLVEYVLFADRPASDVPDDASHATPTVLVAPLSGSGCRVGAVAYLPQTNAWRIQLADYGIATGLGRLCAGGRCGTFPFTAPEVLTSDAAHPYGPAADVFSLGVTMQYVVSRLVLDSSMADRRDAPLAAEWVDEKDKESEVRTTSARAGDSVGGRAKPPFVVPRAWRCCEELLSGSFIRRGAKSATSADEDGDAKSEASSDSACSARGKSSRRGSAGAHAHILAPLPTASGDINDFITRERRRSRCKSCGKLHRHLIELLNAMTDAEPSRRPPLTAVLRSAAVVEQGDFTQPREGAQRRAARSPPGFRRPTQTQREESGGEGRRSGGGGLMWRPPSLSFLSAYADGDVL